MASIYFDPSQPGCLGRVVLRRRGDKVVFARPPRERQGPGVARNVEGFREATAYTKAVFAHPARRAPYEEPARAAGQQVFHFILASFLKYPVIRGIDASGFQGRAGDAIVVRTRVGLAIGFVRVDLRTAGRVPLIGGVAEPLGTTDGPTFRFALPHDLNLNAGATVHAEIVVRDTDGLELIRTLRLAVGDNATPAVG